MLDMQPNYEHDQAIMAEGAIRVLYLDDDCLDRELMSLHIHRHHRRHDAARYELLCVSTIDAARAALAVNSFHVLVLDNKMPASPNFHRTLEKLGEINPDIMIVVTSSEVESAVFKDLDYLDRRPDAIVDKADLRGFINSGIMRAK